VKTLILVQPDRLPASVRELRAAPPAPGHRQLARELAGVGGAGRTGSLERLRSLPALLAEPGPAAADTPPARSDVAYIYDDRLREYDAFFGVTRAAPGAAGAFGQSLFVAYRSVLEEGLGSGSRLSWAEWSGLCAAFHELIALATGTEPGGTVLPVPEPPLLRWHMDPHRRWRIGHHGFFALTQGLIVALNCFRAARAEGDRGTAGRMLGLTARLFDAGAAAFVFTGEFSAAQYQGRVRPSMEPPGVSPGFSGLLSPDHHYLVRLLGLLRPELRDLPAELAPAHRRLAAALAGAYEAHKYVCARFGGDRSVSLRMSEASENTAVDVIHGLKLARGRMVGTPR
jgi:hypothetical protein